MQTFEFSDTHDVSVHQDEIAKYVTHKLSEDEVLVFDFSKVKSVSSGTKSFLDSLVDLIKLKRGAEYVVLGTSEVLRSFEMTKAAKFARSLIQVKEPVLGSAKFQYRTTDDRLFFTLQTATIEAIQELCFMDCVCEEVIPDEELLQQYKHRAVMKLDLNPEYTLVFSMSDKDLISFVEILMSEKISEIDEMMLDWPAEIANHTCNFLKMLWGDDLDKRAQTTIPARVNSEDFEQIKASKRTFKSFIVENEKFNLFVEILK